MVCVCVNFPEGVQPPDEIIELRNVAQKTIRRAIRANGKPTDHVVGKDGRHARRTRVEPIPPTMARLSALQAHPPAFVCERQS
jgi:hypothetical protein